ncbi:hypothetical protein AC578_3184 [Pseudocercospora eumusae]|uniref:Terpene cyclase/mutase family member n=1 Tax=Pseudocercospora eumusae TaxID=321146 RepID=A0A139GWD0_9PEZI|nr:hypothetical protein AC578_3184 [Pseudocercospora eumusae]
MAATRIENLSGRAQKCLELAAQYAYSLQKDDGHWITELRSNISFTAQYVCLCEIVGTSLRSRDDRFEVSRWLLAQQQSDGSWSLAPREPGDLSISVEGYLALKLLGVSAKEEPMLRAKDFILSKGGLPMVGIITQFLLATFGLVNWNELAQVPAELVLMPIWSPINLYAFAHWTRVTAVAMMVIRHSQPSFPLPGHLAAPGAGFLDELFTEPTQRHLRFYPKIATLWRSGHYGHVAAAIGDKIVGLLDPIVKRTAIRTYSLSRCVQFMLERQTDGGYAAFWPANFNCIIALHCQGYSFKHPVIERLLLVIERTFLWKDEHGIRNQVTCGPSWDTALLAIGLCTSGCGDQRLDKTIEWFKSTQILNVRGDYEVAVPGLLPGGWSFQYNNEWYPDTDDTATILKAILLWKPAELTSECVVRGIQWLLGMQCSNGGWGCYDVNNTSYFLQLFPFGRGNEFCDAPCPDVTARILEVLGLITELHHEASNEQEKLPQALVIAMRNACSKAICYLALECNESTGAWKSRWHVNYIDGTASSLQALAYFDDCIDNRVSTMVQRGLAWLKSVQNADGSWGESLLTYNDPSIAGKGQCTPSQTAWALSALITYLSPSDESIERGVEYLLRSQVIPSTRPQIGKTWEQELYVSVAFPNITWLDYTSTRHAYPMIALGQYIKKVRRKLGTV